MRHFAIIMGGLALVACQPAASAEPERPAETAPAATTTAASVQSDIPPADHCFIQVNGTTYVDAACPGDWSVVGDYVSINAGSSNEPAIFAALSQLDGVWTATWTGDGPATHAHEEIGVVTRDGRCWTSATAKLCVPEDGTSPQTAPMT